MKKEIKDYYKRITKKELREELFDLHRGFDELSLENEDLKIKIFELKYTLTQLRIELKNTRDNE